MNAKEDAALDRMMRKLDTRQRVEWTDEMRDGKPALRRLLHDLTHPGISANAAANACIAAFRLRRHAPDDEVYSVFLGLASDSRKKVRTAAATMIVGVLRVDAGHRDNFEAEGKRALEAALERGLEHDAQQLVVDYLAGRVSPFQTSESND